MPQQKVLSYPVLCIPVTSPNTPHTSPHLSRQTEHRPHRPMEKAAPSHMENIGAGDTAALGHRRLGGAPQPRSRATLKTAACKRKDDSVTKTLGHRTTSPMKKKRRKLQKINRSCKPAHRQRQAPTPPRKAINGARYGHGACNNKENKINKPDHPVTQP